MTPPSADAVINQIASIQAQNGLFRSVRSNQRLLYRRVDTNLFFTASTVFTLQQLRTLVSAETQQRIDQISKNAVGSYPIFKNKDGLDTYNFWPTRPSNHFSDGYLFRHFDHFRIPDDIDDTALVYLTTQPSPESLHWLKTKLGQHANGTTRQIRNTYDDYRNLRAYSTWFGKNMGIDFDACAMSNILYCIFRYDLPRNEHDADSLAYLRSVVETGRYVTAPFRCAPHYARPSLIIYHLARLMAAFAIPELNPIRARLLADARAALQQTPNRLERIILSTALMRLGERPELVNLTAVEEEFDQFHFFIAGLLTAYEQPWLHRFAHWPLTQMRWQCEAHCWALVAEYIVLSSIEESRKT